MLLTFVQGGLRDSPSARGNLNPTSGQNPMCCNSNSAFFAACGLILWRQTYACKELQMGGIGQDLRYALRGLWKNPGFTACAHTR
jgi:hypothetical protein